jgi:8-oxo-dGTP diphosphatase
VELTTLVYVRDGARTLMLHRGDASDRLGGRWNALGGKFEPGESPEACAVREVHEESGLHARSLELKGIITFPSFAYGGDVMTFVFVVHDYSGTPQDGPEGTLHWIDTASLQRLELWEGDRVFLPWLELPGIFSATFRYDGPRYLGHEVVFYGRHTG